ncbi:MAG: hypothetical protein ACRD29_00055 [Acidimicrobiales bacterium]
MALSADAADELVTNVVANQRLEGQELRPEAISLMAAYARGESDHDTYIERAKANIAELCLRMASDAARTA